MFILSSSRIAAFLHSQAPEETDLRGNTFGLRGDASLDRAVLAVVSRPQ